MKYLVLLLISITFSQLKAEETYSAETAIKEFYSTMKTEHQFSKAELDKWFEGVELNQNIIDSMNRPAEKTLTWAEYRRLFVKNDRIEQGVEFWQKHHQTLQLAEDKFGVPAHLIVGLIGVETRYGRIMGSHDIFRSLYTLAFHYPRRASFFTRELTSFLVLARDQGWQKDTMKGSYAGAMGYGQFMPSSYQAYAVDFDGDGKIQLVDNVVDAIGSVANYISKHRWQPEQPIVDQVAVTGDVDKLLSTGLKPNRKVSELRAAGVEVPDSIADDSKVLFFKLNDGEDQYWVGHNNFYVISRYNPRIFYTKAVVELAEAIEDAFQSQAVKS
jgi:membrane-bound lytic murein transglycosylase B